MKNRLVTMKVDPSFNQWLRIQSAKRNMNLTEFGRFLARNRDEDIEIKIDFQNDKKKGKKDNIFW
jgi:hypothetical protein